MKTIVLATQKILNGERDVENVSYSKDGTDIYIMFSHSASNEAGEFRPTTWDAVVALAPFVADIQFDLNDDILIYDVHEKRWRQYAG